MASEGSTRSTESVTLAEAEAASDAPAISDRSTRCMRHLLLDSRYRERSATAAMTKNAIGAGSGMYHTAQSRPWTVGSS